MTKNVCHNNAQTECKYHKTQFLTWNAEILIKCHSQVLCLHTSNKLCEAVVFQYLSLK